MQTCSLQSALPLCCWLLQVFAFSFLATYYGGAQSLGPPCYSLGRILLVPAWAWECGGNRWALGGEWVGRAWAGSADNLKNYVNFTTYNELLFAIGLACMYLYVLHHNPGGRPATLAGSCTSTQNSATPLCDPFGFLPLGTSAKQANKQQALLLIT
jgi:hypothetical protein